MSSQNNASRLDLGQGLITTSASEVAIQADGGIIAAESEYSGNLRDFFASQYNTDGTLAAGADVAASIDLTDAANRGADWLLDASTALARSTPLASGFAE